MSKLKIALITPWKVKCGHNTYIEQKLNYNTISDGLSKEMLVKVPKQLLIDLYDTEKLSITKIANNLNIGDGTVYRLLKYYNMHPRRYEPYPDTVVLNNETDKAYFAGYLDGDGTILFSVVKTSRTHKGVYLRPYVALISKDKPLLEGLQSIMGGGLVSFIYKDSREKKLCYTIRILRHESILRFLTDITPYLKLKRRQAELMMEYCRDRIEKIQKYGRCAPISDRGWQIAEEVKKLNA